MTLLVLLMLSNAALGVQADVVGVTVVEVLDGDTLRVELPDGIRDVDLAGIDTPELGQKWGVEAQEHLSMLVSDSQVVIVRNDKNGGAASSIEADGVNLALAMAQAGFAWVPDSGDTSEEIAVAVFVARSGRRGMWVDEYATLLHPARWREKYQAVPTPSPPTPTPTPSLSQYAQFSELVADDEGDVVIKGIPTKKVRSREMSLLDSTLRNLRYPRQRVEKLEDYIALECGSDLTAGTPGGGATYWSEEDQRWVSALPKALPPKCASYAEEIVDLRNTIAVKKRNAVNRALRFGLTQAHINEQLRKHQLENY